MVRSVDFWLAVLVWVVAAPMWLSDKWPDQVIGVLPNVLGFTLGGFAIFLGFGSDEFKRALAQEDEASSVYLSVSAAFLLFVSLQLAALMWALGAKALYFQTPVVLLPTVDFIVAASFVGGAVGYFLFTYSLALALRAAVRIFRLSRWYNTYLAQLRDSSHDDN